MTAAVVIVRKIAFNDVNIKAYRLQVGIIM